LKDSNFSVTRINQIHR